MQQNEYRIHLEQIFNLAYLVQQLKIADALQQINRAEAIGPMLDPTLYLKAATNLEWQKRTVEAALKFQQAIEKITQDPKYRT